MRKWITVAAAAVLVVVVPSGAAMAKGGGELRDSLDALVRAGVTGAVVRVDDGQRVRTVASGVASLESRRPVGGADSFRIASVTKSFVSTVVLQLVGEGRVRLSDSVERWLPGVVPGGRGITVRQLLNHTSGLFNYTDDQQWLAAAMADPARSWGARELVAAAVAHPPLSAPGAQWRYNNTNYILAGLIAETVAKRPLARLVAERITGPLRLRDTFLAADPRVGPNHVHGYLRSPEGEYTDTTSWSPTMQGAAGAMVSTPADVSRFYRALLSGELLDQRQLQEMLTTVRVEERNGGYGLGIYYIDTRCGRVWGHAGDFPGHHTIAYQDRSGRRSAVLEVATDVDQEPGSLFDNTVTTMVCQMMGKRR
ncbi:serine hydrolase domain-containing protein [Actinokineospora terrae]|uniref:D-alanyl-D-alanine carboxypeptidase n=1 Tax=Actinokineospora terrae TaxID=155974 RepID=A0A1H9X1P4_9PSEU|nr:serine hydrolase domain-containing protein [Actinokineospora terrae]SES39951.1 D-alanyl-D-alanine carboxypeptidase [Actinokineospora terrae]